MPITDKYRPHYTYDDYCQWERNWELIGGKPYAMSPAPVPAHKCTSLLLSIQFEKSLSACRQYKIYPPLDWKIAENTIVKPDLLVVHKQIEKKFLDFTPPLVIEILSPATSSKDRRGKMELYFSQGVKYYIISDPQFKKTEVYQISQGRYQQVAVNPENFTFFFEGTCTATVSFLDIWD